MVRGRMGRSGRRCGEENDGGKVGATRGKLRGGCQDLNTAQPPSRSQEERDPQCVCFGFSSSPSGSESRNLYFIIGTRTFGSRTIYQSRNMGVSDEDLFMRWAALQNPNPSVATASAANASIVDSNMGS